jgi:hypothetical protein
VCVYFCGLFVTLPVVILLLFGFKVAISIAATSMFYPFVILVWLVPEFACFVSQKDIRPLGGNEKIDEGNFFLVQHSVYRARSRLQ